MIKTNYTETELRNKLSQYANNQIESIACDGVQIRIIFKEGYATSFLSSTACDTEICFTSITSMKEACKKTYLIEGKKNLEKAKEQEQEQQKANLTKEEKKEEKETMKDIVKTYVNIEEKEGTVKTYYERLQEKTNYLVEGIQNWTRLGWWSQWDNHSYMREGMKSTVCSVYCAAEWIAEDDKKEALTVLAILKDLFENVLSSTPIDLTYFWNAFNRISDLADQVTAEAKKQSESVETVEPEAVEEPKQEEKKEDKAPLSPSLEVEEREQHNKDTNKMTKLNLTSYDYETIECTLDIEQALKSNLNATFTKAQIEMVKDTINNTINPGSDLVCSGLKIEHGLFFPKIETEVQCSTWNPYYRSRFKRAQELEVWDYSISFKSVDEIREYMNDGYKTAPISQLDQEYQNNLETDVPDSLITTIKSQIPEKAAENIQEIILDGLGDGIGIILKDKVCNHTAFIFGTSSECIEYLSNPQEINTFHESDLIAYACEVEKQKQQAHFSIDDESGLLEAINNTSLPEADEYFESIEFENGKFTARYNGSYFEFDNLDDMREFIGLEEKTWTPSAVRPEQIARRIGWHDEADLIKWTEMTLEDYNRRLLISFIPLRALNAVKNIYFEDYKPIIEMKDKHLFIFEDFQDCITFFKDGYRPETEDLTKKAKKSLLTMVKTTDKALNRADLSKIIKELDLISSKDQSSNQNLTEIKKYATKGLLEVETLHQTLKSIIESK